MATVGQTYEVLGILANRVDWSSLDKGRLQEQVIKQPDLLASEFYRFLENGARLVIAGDMKVAMAPFDPVAFLGEGWSLIEEEQDKRSAVLTEVDMSKAEFLTCLKEGESRITGEEKLVRLKQENCIRYGATVFMGLWQDYQVHKEDSVLERLYQDKNITYMDFFGDVFLSPRGDRSVLYLYRGGAGAWGWRYFWLDGGWDAGYVSVVSPQVSCA